MLSAYEKAVPQVLAFLVLLFSLQLLKLSKNNNETFDDGHVGKWNDTSIYHFRIENRAVGEKIILVFHSSSYFAV